MSPIWMSQFSRTAAAGAAGSERGREADYAGDHRDPDDRADDGRAHGHRRPAAARLERHPDARFRGGGRTRGCERTADARTGGYASGAAPRTPGGRRSPHDRYDRKQHNEEKRGDEPRAEIRDIHRDPRMQLGLPSDTHRRQQRKQRGDRCDQRRLTPITTPRPSARVRSCALTKPNSRNTSSSSASTVARRASACPSRRMVSTATTAPRRRSAVACTSSPRCTGAVISIRLLVTTGALGDSRVSSRVNADIPRVPSRSRTKNTWYESGCARKYADDISPSGGSPPVTGGNPPGCDDAARGRLPQPSTSSPVPAMPTRRLSPVRQRLAASDSASRRGGSAAARAAAAVEQVPKPPSIGASSASVVERVPRGTDTVVVRELAQPDVRRSRFHGNRPGD